jgi:hypothetical protein
MAPSGVLMEPPDEVVIGQGSEWETTVLDVRGDAAWAQESFRRNPGPSQGIYWHHTVSRSDASEVEEQYQWLLNHRNEGPYGLPYNFIVFPSAPHHVWYLNAVDKAWPHTYGHNDATAICAVGNWDANTPPDTLAERMWHLSHALMVMWGHDIPVFGHRDTYATACPGRYLYADLQRLKG